MADLAVPVAALVNAGRVFQDGAALTTALHPASCAFHAGELVLVVGPSGSGKTTILSLLGCVLAPSGGEVYVAGVRTGALNAAALAALRLRAVGFLFQGANLVAPLSARANVELPMMLAGVGRVERRERARAALIRLGLAHREHALPSTLSGGEQQRVALARALANEPALLLCDEPTAALDAASAARTMGELRARADDGRAVVVVTHDPRLAPFADRTIEVSDGRIVAETRRRDPAPAEWRNVS